MESIEVKVKKLIPDVELPICNGAGYDLFVPETITIKPGETVLARTGLAMKLPLGWHALLNVRSSTWGKYGVKLTNQTGIIDNAYCGNDDEWLLSLYRSTRFDDTITIPKGARIAQFRLEKDGPRIDWEEVDDLESTNRGGFGSTGE